MSTLSFEKVKVRKNCQGKTKPPLYVVHKDGRAIGSVVEIDRLISGLPLNELLNDKADPDEIVTFNVIKAWVYQPDAAEERLFESEISITNLIGKVVRYYRQKEGK